jgi:hypothetical protein
MPCVLTSRRAHCLGLQSPHSAMQQRARGHGERKRKTVHYFLGISSLSSFCVAFLSHMAANATSTRIAVKGPTHQGATYSGIVRGATPWIGRGWRLWQILVRDGDCIDKHVYFLLGRIRIQRICNAKGHGVYARWQCLIFCHCQ